MDKFAEHKKGKKEGMNYSFSLFVIREGENSVRALKNLEHLCEKWLHGRYKIDIVDVLEDFQTAIDHNILITPSVVRTNPEPQVTIYGDLSDSRKFVEAMNLEEEDAK